MRFLIVIPESPVLGRVLETAGEFARSTGHEVVSASPEPDGLLRPVPDADILLLTPRLCLEPGYIGGATRLRCILFPTIGVDPLDLEAATARGIAVGHGAPEESVTSMAEATVGLIAALMHRLPEKQAVLASGAWREPPALGRMLRGRTVGLVGFGRIGRAVARLLEPWRVRLLFHDPAASEPAMNALAVPLETLLAESDVVSLHASLMRATPAIGRRELALMKPDAILVNTARGGLLDEDALADALESGRLAGAALDVFTQEPLPAGSRLRTMPNVILTPHSIGHTVELMEAMERTFIANLRAVLAGNPPLQLYNPSVLPRWRARFGNAETIQGEGR